MVTFEGFPDTLTVSKNFDHLVCAHTRPTTGKVPACSKKFCRSALMDSSTDDLIIELTVVFSSQILSSWSGTLVDL